MDEILYEGLENMDLRLIRNEILLIKDSVYMLSSLDELSLKSEQLLMNTNYFLETRVNWDEYKPKHIRVKIQLVLKPVLGFLPHVEWADRNFKQWGINDYELNRINYGIRLRTVSQKGNKRIDLLVQSGYTQKAELNYRLMSIDKEGKFGLNLISSFAQNKEVWLITRSDSLRFLKPSSKSSIIQFKNILSFNMRKGPFTSESWSLGFNSTTVKDTVTGKDGNPKFLLPGNRQNEFYIQHRFSFDNTDNCFYPLEGYRLLNILSLGKFISDTTSIERVKESLEIGVYKQLIQKIYLAVSAKFTYQNQPEPYMPYYNLKALGYEDCIRGYEQNSIEGHSLLMTKLNLKYALIKDQKIKTGIRLQKKKIAMPFGVFLNFFADAGQVWNNQWSGPDNVYKNVLINSWLFGYGAGLDFLFFNDKVLRLEYAFNKTGDRNFNLFLKKSF
ncbi:MAG: BamA/TamA family outer membrane protein [Flavobacteriales bacterium]|nr:BamA/TamA family outer membrane protein [Flavobacteriales bacterium]